MIPGKTNSKPNTARRAPAQSSHECIGAGFLAAASRCHGGRSTPLNRDGVVTAASQRHRPADPAWTCQLNEGEGSTGQSKNRGMIYSKRYNKTCFKDRAHLSTFKFFIFEKFSCFIVLVVFLVIVQSSELISVWFCEKMTFKKKIISYYIFAIYVGGASLGVPTACRLIAVSGARLPSTDGLGVRCIKNAPPC